MTTPALHPFSLRLSAKMLERLRTMSERTRIPQTVIVKDALEVRLTKLERELAVGKRTDFGVRNDEET